MISNKVYAHRISSFTGRSTDWYKKSLLEQLKSLDWEVKNSKLINLEW